MKPLLFIVSLLTLTSCVSIRVTSDYDTAANFTDYSTYAFFKPGIDEVQISDLDKRRILSALESTLARKGLTVSKTPKILVSFHTKAEKNVHVNESFIGGWGSPFYGPYGGWGWGWGWGFNRPYNVNTSTSGILYIDLIDATNKRLIWQGKGIGNLSKGTPEERTAKINEFVSEIMSAYPPSGSE